MCWLSGVYSVVLTVEDKAGNWKDARRFFIFDNSSDVTINSDEDKQLLVSTTAENTSHTWVTSLQGGDNAGQQARKDGNFYFETTSMISVMLMTAAIFQKLQSVYLSCC